jgi:two-component system CheB/CheR fusion protein
VVVNDRYEVLYFSTRSKLYLDALVGEPTLDIMRMTREELRPALRAAIYKAFADRQKVVFHGVKVTDGQGEGCINLIVEPFPPGHSAERMAMVIMEPVPCQTPLPPPAEGNESSGDHVMLVGQLEEQLRITHEQLQATMEQLETSNEGFMSANEELMSINEEFQSTNEELQSTNEELETSKEELQALNEELATINAELQAKVEELNHANSDMENLFANAEIATIFLDLQLNIKRFTPAIAAILNLIPADVGRPFRHLAGTIDWSGLPNDVATVLEKLTPVEREVTVADGSACYIMRILPYRATDGKISGIAITLIDITERKRAEERIRSQMEELTARNRELTRFNKASVDREMRMIELKKEVNEFCRNAGLPPRYEVDFAEEK